MKSLFSRILLPTLLSGILVSNLLADPVANPDSFTMAEDSILFVGDDDSVLGNDTPDPGAAISAVLVTPPSSGRLEFDGDGTFVYVPAPGFTGTDTFTYMANGESGPQQFTVVQGSSNVNVNATLNVSGLGSDSDSSSSSITGDMLVQLTPYSSPFSEIQVQDLNVTLADAMALRFSFAFGLAGVNADTAANGISVTMDSPGAPSAVDGAGNFSQTGNTLRMTGSAEVSGTGLASGQVPQGTQNFDNPVENVDFAGTVVESGGITTLTVPLIFTGSFPIDANSLDLSISGTIVATAPTPTSPPQSAPTTVTINVMDVDDAPMTVPDLYYVTENSSVSFSAAQGATETLIATGAEWSYLDDGSDQGTAWREFGFDDGAWPRGNAELGYGDGDEAKEIGFGGDGNNVHETYYFRRSFDVTGARDVERLWVRILRDDGAVVYINGVQVLSSNMPAVFDSSTFAAETTAGTDETKFFEFDIDPSLLYEGENIIAVEVHQAGATSSDVSFNLELIRTRASGLLANDNDEEGDILTAALHMQSPNGTATVSGSGALTFVPQTDFIGETSFLYSVTPTGVAPRALLPRGSKWRYLADGSNQGTAWYGAGFDDSAWPVGRTKIGYGDGEEATVVGFGGNAGAKFATTYFRNEFWVDDPQSAEITMEIRRDDAAAVYLNGVEVYRDSNLTAGAGFEVYASSGVGDETAFVSISPLTSLFLNGRNEIAVEVHQSSPTSSDLGFDFAVLADVPMVTLVDQGSEWKYLDDGSDQGTAWQAAGFDDSDWDSGPAILGYGEGNESTEVSFGADSANKHETTYFRKTFQVADATYVRGLLLRYLVDDGMAVYINGIDVFRDGLANGAAFDTLATRTVGGLEEYAFSHVSIDSSVLVTGENTIAVEVHQGSAGSSDLIFDLELSAAQTEVVQRATVRVVNDDLDNDGMSDDYERSFGLIVGVDDSADDLDGDGRTNIEESIAYTDPHSSASLLETTAVSTMAGSVEIQFSSVSGKTYVLEQSSDLSDWTPVPGENLVASSGSESFTVSAPAGTNYWRVVVSR